MEEKIREKFEISSDELKNLVYEEYLEINGKDIPIEEIETKYIQSGRHQEYHSLIFKRLSDGKFFKANFSKSTQDSIGWDECNYDFKITEVFQKTETIITYK